MVFDSNAITKMQSAILASIIVIAAIGGIIGYVLISKQETSDAIKIGVCLDLGTQSGDGAWEGAVLAVDQINAEGGILGREVEIIAEDNDGTLGDFSLVTAAMNRLITFHGVDFIVGSAGSSGGLAIQDIIAEHKMIFIECGTPLNVLSERVLDDYGRYKYWFRNTPNNTALHEAIIDSMATLGEYTGFRNVGYLADDMTWNEDYIQAFNNYLPKLGFNVVYQERVLSDTVDFTSYLYAAESANVEIIVPLMVFPNSISFIKEWYNRQSPFVVWGINAMSMDSQYWDWTENKCETESCVVGSFVAGYPMTEKTIPAREAFIQRWGHVPMVIAGATYDAIRFILSDAIERAGTTETEAVIAALEKTDLYKTDGRVVFTASHDLLIGPGYGEVIMFQWQKDGTRVPVYPKYIMEEAGATYTYPDWPGPWD